MRSHAQALASEARGCYRAKMEEKVAKAPVKMLVLNRGAHIASHHVDRRNGPGVFGVCAMKRGSYGIENCEECKRALRCCAATRGGDTGASGRLCASSHGAGAMRLMNEKGQAPRNMRFWSECLS